MSWFKHKPKLKEPPKHLPHHFNSPMSATLMEQTKQNTKLQELVGENHKLTRKNNETK